MRQLTDSLFTACLQAARDFLADSKVTLVGFSWASSDQEKMQSTFGINSSQLGNLVDLQSVAQGLGYQHSVSLAKLTKWVLGIEASKSKNVTMSNWEAKLLSRAQLKYASLDVLVAAQVG